MMSINEFKYPTRITMENLIKEGEKHKISNAAFDNNITRASNKLARQYSETDIEIVHVPIYFGLLFKTYLENYNDLNDIENKFDDKDFHKSPLHILHLWCSYYDEYENKRGSFIKLLNDYMKQKKNIFVYFDFHDYLIDEEILKKTGNLAYSVHSTCCLIYLDNDNNYNAYYFNSHGEALKSDIAHGYNKYITRKRYKNLKLNKPLDFYVLNHLFKYINKYNELYNPGSLFINYEPNKKYNYYGPNLQEGDKFGICFVFPFLFYINLISNFRIKFTYKLENKEYKFTSFCKLMKNNNIEKIIKIIMCNYNKVLQGFVVNLDRESEEEIQSNISDTIEREGTKFTKYLYSLILNFTTQKCFI